MTEMAKCLDQAPGALADHEMGVLMAACGRQLSQFAVQIAGSRVQPGAQAGGLAPATINHATRR